MSKPKKKSAKPNIKKVPMRTPGREDVDIEALSDKMNDRMDAVMNDLVDSMAAPDGTCGIEEAEALLEACANAHAKFASYVFGHLDSHIDALACMREHLKAFEEFCLKITADAYEFVQELERGAVDIEIEIAPGRLN